MSNKALFIVMAVMLLGVFMVVFMRMHGYDEPENIAGSFNHTIKDMGDVKLTVKQPDNRL